MQTQNPFKGPSSYEDGDKFYGRKGEIKEMIGLIRSETLTMLFSRSGTGKSSLLKAGLFPELRSQSEFFPIYLHLNEAVIKETADNSLCNYIIKKCKDEINHYFKDKSDFVVTLAEDTGDKSLFEFIHFTELKEVDKTSEVEYIIKPVLIFDQFEEIFTSPFDKNDLHVFLKEINCLIENELPDYLREKAMINENNQFTKLKNTLKSKQKNFRVAFAFREEYLPQFESLCKEIPALRFTNSRYRLEPFTVETAQNIIVSTAPNISPETATVVAENISTEMEGFEEKKVDPFLLSLICQIIYPDLLEVDDNNTGDSQVKIKGLVENALETYIQQVYSGINEETKEFIETRLITSDGKKNSVNYNDVQANEALNKDILKLVDNPETRLLSIGQFLDSRHITILHDRLLPPLIQRKDERKRKEESIAFAVRKEKYDRENRRRQRVFIGIFASAIIALGLILYFKNIARRETEKEWIEMESLRLKADTALILARKKEHVADSIHTRNLELGNSIKMAYAKAIDDSIRNGIAIRKAESTLYSRQKANNLLRSTVVSLQKSIDSNSVHDDLALLSLESQESKDLLFKNLFRLKNTHQEEAYLEYIYAVEEALDLKAEAASNEANSYEVLSKAQKLWKANQDNEVVGIIIINLLNKSLFYSQLVTLPKDPYEYFKPFLSFSDPDKIDHSKFAFNVDKYIYLGNVHTDSLSVSPGLALPTFEGNFKTDSAASPVNENIDTFSKMDTSLNNIADTANINQSENFLSSLVYYDDQITGSINGALFTYSLGSTNSIPKSIPLQKHDYEVLSPNGRFLVTYSDIDSVRITDITKSNLLSTTLKISPYHKIKSVIFSSDSKRLLVLTKSNEFLVFNIRDSTVEQKTRVRNLRMDQILAVNFTPDSNFILAATNRGIYINQMEGSTSVMTFNPKYRIPDLFRAYDIRSISLSPDSNKILMETRLGLIVFMKTDGSSFSYSDEFDPKAKLNYKIFNTSGFNSVGGFIDSNSLVVVSDIGKVYFLKVYPEFTSLSDAFMKIKLPKLTLLERLKIDPGNYILFTEILNSNDNELIINAAQNYCYNYLYPKNYVRDTMQLNRGIALWRAFIQSEKSIVKKINIANIRNGIFLIRQISGLDTTKRNKEGYYTDILSLANKYENAQTRSELAIVYGNLSFYSFFSRNYIDGLIYAEKGLELDTRPNNYIYTNKALGLLLNNRVEEAEKLYNLYKDSTVLNRSVKFRTLFLEDLTDLEKYGIINPNDPLIFAEVKKIRENILK